MTNSRKTGNWQDESQIGSNNPQSGNDDPIDNPEHMETPEVMTNPQSTHDVGRKPEEPAPDEKARMEPEGPRSGSRTGD